MTRVSRKQLRLKLEVAPLEKVGRPMYETRPRELVDALAMLLLDASRALRGSEGRPSDEREDHG
jgi:hypothetical protein